MQVIRSWFGRAEVDLFAFQETTHCPLWYSMVEPKGDAGVRCPSTRVASGPSILFSPFSSFTSSIDQDSRLTSHSPAQCFRLDQPDMDARSGCIARGGPMASPIQAGNALSGSGAALEPQPWAIQHACLASEWEPSGTLGQGVLTTLQAARAPSTVVIYTGCWEIFTCWCQSKCINPVSCDVLSLIFFFSSSFWKGGLRNQVWGGMWQPSLIAMTTLRACQQAGPSCLHLVGFAWMWLLL